MTDRIFNDLFDQLRPRFIGLDRVVDDLMGVHLPTISGYPPYNVEKLSDDEYNIIVALAGFSKKDVNVAVENAQLIIEGNIKELNDETEIVPGKSQAKTFIHKGIAARSFKLSFRLADFIEVDSAEMQDGLLTISLKRLIPEEKKPKLIEVK